MALSLGVAVGRKVWVGDSLLSVVSMPKPTLIVVKVDDGPDLVISDKESTEVMPNVRVSAGMCRTGICNRLLFEAPREIPINRVVEEYEPEFQVA